MEWGAPKWPPIPRAAQGAPAERGAPWTCSGYLREAVRAVLSLMLLAISWAPFLL
jgi:hypothetical protein